ncbi:MAG: PQQ-binding-like beta-propeller repeat protein [Candidatus Bathyarchaeota archaeon]|nr:PQQ-binding-like beta-propeller repeat protein [Candidatus Bathyarchaeota archaeon]
MKKAIPVTAAVVLIALVVLTVSRVAMPDGRQLQVDGKAAATVSFGYVVWAKTFGGSADDRAFYSLPVDDGCLVVGSSKSFIANTTVGWVLRLDGDGAVLWNRTFFQSDGTELRYAVALEDGFLLVGNQFTASGDVNGFAARVGSDGKLFWQTVVGAEKIDKLFSGVAVKDGVVLFGLTYSYGVDQSKAWAVKLGLNGEVVWNKTFKASVDIALRSAVLCQNSDIVAAGYADVGDGNFDFYLLKLDNSGDLLWNKTYGSTNSEKAYALAKAADGGYVLVGEKQSVVSDTDTWVVKVNSDGEPLWNRTVGGEKADSPTCVLASKTGGYLVAGYTFSFGSGQRDFWLFKISEEGKLMFSFTHGDKAFQEAYGVVECTDGCFILVGWTDPFGEPALAGRAVYDFYVVKLKL